MKLICIMMTASKMATKRETQGFLCLNKKLWILLIKLKLFAVQYACNVTDHISFFKKNISMIFFQCRIRPLLFKKLRGFFFDFLLKTSFFIKKNLVRCINWLCEMIIRNKRRACFDCFSGNRKNLTFIGLCHIFT